RAPPGPPGARTGPRGGAGGGPPPKGHRPADGGGAPAMSPSHHVSQISPNRAQLACPASARLATPTVALTAVATPPASAANTKKLRARANTSRPPAQRFTSQTPTSASKVLPAAMPRDEATDPAAVTFTRNAPTKIAGHIAHPDRRRAASAMPVGGHPAVALACTNASETPSLPATT